MSDFELKPEIINVLQKINFIERYDELVNTYKLKETSMEKIDKDKIFEILSDLGYEAKYYKSEKFFSIKKSTNRKLFFWISFSFSVWKCGIYLDSK